MDNLEKPIKKRPALLVRVVRTLVLAYFGMLLAGCACERSLIFRPTKMPEVPKKERMNLSKFLSLGMSTQEADFTSADGTRLHGLLVMSGKTLDENTVPILFCHGNGGWLAHNLGWVFFEPQPEGEPAKYAFFLFDYRAYGYSEGKSSGLSESHLYADARAARTWLAEHLKRPETDIVLMGHSMGGAVAVDLAQDGTPKLVVAATFDSMPDVVNKIMPIYPAGLLMQNRFDSAKKIKNVHAPLLQFHGTLDRTVAISCGRALFAAANEPKTFVELNVEHNDFSRPDIFEKIREFLAY